MTIKGSRDGVTTRVMEELECQKLGGGFGCGSDKAKGMHARYCMDVVEHW